MPQTQTITAMDPKLIMRELDELDRVVHRLRTRLEITAPQKTVHAPAQNAWSMTHGAIGRELGKKMIKHFMQSRRKDAKRLDALLALSKHRK